MALKFPNFSKASPETDRRPETSEIKKDPAITKDPERQASVTASGRRMSRIDEPPGISDTDSGVSIGAQIASEKDNAIQYRTCGWKKVGSTLAARSQNSSYFIKQPYLK